MDLSYIKKRGDYRRKSNNHQIKNTNNSKSLSYVSCIDEVNISNKKLPIYVRESPDHDKEFNMLFGERRNVKYTISHTILNRILSCNLCSGVR